KNPSITRVQNIYLNISIPAVGIEPTLQKRNGILSPARLPIPPRWLNIIDKKLPNTEVKMERKIGLAPISHSGKEYILRVELLPQKIKLNGAEDRTCTYISFREGMYSKS